MGVSFFFFFLFLIFFFKTAPLQVFSSSFLTSACIIAAIVFVLSDHSNVSLVNTFFSIFYFFVFFAFCFISVLYFSMPLPLKEKKKKEKTVLYCCDWLEFVC